MNFGDICARAGRRSHGRESFGVRRIGATATDPTPRGITAMGQAMSNAVWRRERDLRPVNGVPTDPPSPGLPRGAIWGNDGLTGQSTAAEFTAWAAL
ncbi:MAG: hypothetical protein IIB61_04340 [Planctomycetes bacterium]|nr:hypothetical protein [Planctomycetota bacterium]